MNGGPGGGVRAGGITGIKSGQDLLCGLLFILLGALGLWVSRDYAMGSPVRLGTGVFPRLLCWGLIICGVVTMIKAFMSDGERLTPWAMRPVIMITLGTVLFSLLIDGAGLVISMLVLMACGAVAGQDHRWKQTAVFMVIMVAIGVGLFIYGLGMPIKVLPWR
jgi:hypothetical protein